MGINQDLEKMKFDIRLIDYYLEIGKITRDEYLNYLKDLPDSTQVSEAITIDAESPSPANN